MSDTLQSDSSYISPKKSSLILFFLIALGMLLLIQGFSLIPLSALSNRYDGKWSIDSLSTPQAMSLPYLKRLTKQETVVLSTVLPATKSQSLILTQIKSTAIRVTMNGIIIYQIGDNEEPTANFWNNYIVIPLTDSESNGRTLSLELTGTQVIFVSQKIFIENSKKAGWIGTLHQLFSNDLLLFFMGGSVTIGLLLIVMSVHKSRLKLSSRLIGTAGVLITIWVLDTTYRTSTGSHLTYVLLKKIFLMSGYLGVFCFSAGLDHYHAGKFTISRWSLLPTLGCLGAVAVAPTVGILYQWLPVLNTILIVNMSIVILLIYKKMRMYPLLVIAAFIGTLAFIQTTLNIIFQFSVPPILHYIVVLISIMLSLQLIFEQRKIVQERDMFRSSMEKDPLTGAHNRRILDELEFSRFSSALFLDFDNFKYYNDRYGHQKGDELLQHFVSIAQKLLRQEDLIIRFGGDEFLILLRAATDEISIEIAERIRKEFKSIAGDSKVDVSYGLSAVNTDEPFDLEHIDKKMYVMKMKKKETTG